MGRCTLETLNMRFPSRKDKSMGKVEQNAKNRMVAVNERGALVGESHPRAELTDHEVDLMLELRAQGFTLGWLARKFEVSKSCAQHVCSGRNRSHLVVRLVSVKRRT